MKTYRIKPLKWEENAISRSLESGIYTIHTFDPITCQPCAKLRRSSIFERPMPFPSVEAAKAKAQELHEQELLKYLEEIE